MSAPEEKLPTVTPARRRREPALEDPVQRCARHGAGVLSLRECISVLLSSEGDSSDKAHPTQRLMRKITRPYSEADQERALFRTLESATTTATPELGPTPGVREARLLAAFEIARRYHHFRTENRDHTTGRTHLSQLTRLALTRVDSHWRCLPVEWMGFVPAFRTRLGSLCVVERGVRTHVNTDPAELFARLLVLRPTGFFLFHNHPSGELTPSASDHDLTHQVRSIGDRLGVKLYAHWIVSGSRESEVEGTLR